MNNFKLNLERDQLSSNTVYTVSSVRHFGYFKKLKLIPGDLYVDVPLSACVGKNEEVFFNDGSLFVKCINGDAKIFHSYLREETIKAGEIQLNILVKEITDSDEYNGCHTLAEFHYRDNSVAGRTAKIIACTFHPLYPKVLGYIELATPFLMNKPRGKVLNSPFAIDNISWECWDSKTMSKYINTIVRISRCVVYPEFRSLGLGQLLVKHAYEFAKTHWQVAGLKPYFIEISADMLKYVPFAEKAGMHFIGETEGNLSRLHKDMKYLTSNVKRVKEGQVVLKDTYSCGIVDQQLSRMNKALMIMEEKGLSQESFISWLEKAT